MVPLSDHEQRLLDQIEQALYADDPKFASAVRSARARVHVRRWLALSIIGVVAGLALILVGLAAKLIFLGVIGFVLIVAACAYAAALWGRRSGTGGPEGPSGASSSGAKARKAGVRTRMEDRIRRRFDEN
jgi:hypothetical protein